MGIFSGIKKVFNIGGISVRVQAPASIQITEPAIPVTLVFTTKSPQTIKGLKVQQIQRTIRSIRNQSNTQTPADNILSELANNDVFQINPGEAKTLQFSLQNGAGNAIQNALPEGNGLGVAAGILNKMTQINDAYTGNSYRYLIRATVAIEGSLGASNEVPIQMLKAGQTGGGIQIDL